MLAAEPDLAEIVMRAFILRRVSWRDGRTGDIPSAVGDVRTGSVERVASGVGEGSVVVPGDPPLPRPGVG